VTGPAKKKFPRRQVMHSIGLDADCDAWITEQARRGWKKNRAIMMLIRQEIAKEQGSDRIEHLTRIGLRSEDHALRLRAIENQRAMMAWDRDYRKDNGHRIAPHPSVAGEFVPVSYDAWVEMVDAIYEEMIREDTAFEP
jgi:hypothetical protein